MHTNLQATCTAKVYAILIITLGDLAGKITLIGDHDQHRSIVTYLIERASTAVHTTT